MLDQSRARDGAPSGFRIIVPDYCRPGQVICVQARGKEKESPELFLKDVAWQGPDGQQVEVTVPMGVGPGQPMWVQARRATFGQTSPMGADSQVQPRASASTAASTAQSSEDREGQTF